MRFTPSFNADLGQTQIEFSGNCYTDALPMLRALLIRKQEIDLTSQSIALATAVLAADYIGDQFEFVGLRIGGDYAEAIETIVGRRVAIANVDGFNRTIATSEVDIVAGPATETGWTATAQRFAGDAPLMATTWSGDFVNARTRRSTGFAFGDYQTNAALFADETMVSIAIGLVHARDRCRTLYVPLAEGANPERYASIAAALRIIGTSLEWLGPAPRQAAITAIAPPKRRTSRKAA